MSTTTKASTSASTLTTSSAPETMYPPLLTLQNPLLGSIIPLPAETHVVYSIYTVTPSSQPDQAHTYIEQARRQILSHNASLTLLQSLLPSVHIDGNPPILYVFQVTCHDQIGECLQMMRGLTLEGLQVSESSTFTPQELYPCSAACASLRVPCASCLSVTTSNSTEPSTPCLLPRGPLRLVYSHFLEAIRGRFIDDVCEAARKDSQGRLVMRFKRGIVLGRSGMGRVDQSNWSKGWEYHALRPLIFCHMEISLSTTRLTIHPLLRPTPYIPLLIPPSLPLPMGTPITLLPHTVPAYFLAEYRGSEATLSKLFREALVGWGAGDWDPTEHVQRSTSDHSERARHKGRKKYANTGYIFAWINVQNKHGEAKGMHVIWPRKLCLRYTGECVNAEGKGIGRELLTDIPELPGPLRPSALANALSEDTGWIEQWRATSLIRRSCTTPIGSLQRMSLGGDLEGEKRIEGCAMDVGSFVDAVAKEREKERERLMREREMAAQAPTKAVGGAEAGRATPPVSGSTTFPATPTSNAIWAQNGVSPLQSVQPPSQSGGQVPTAGPSQPQPTPDFYPSPPISNPPVPVPMPFEAATSPVASPSHVPAAEGDVPPLEPSPLPPHTPAEQRAEEADEAPLNGDPFATLDSVWSRQNDNDDFMSINLGFNMGFGMNVGNARSSGAYDRSNGGDLDDAFTEDDFDFFDRPSPIKPGSAPTSIPASTRTAPFSPGAAPNSGAFAPGTSPPLFGDLMHLSGPTGTTPGGHPSPWGATPLGEGMTPKFFDHLHPDGAAHTLDLLSSPGPSPSSHSAPATPNVRLALDSDVLMRARKGSRFDPIPFASSHRIADGKYSMGKFALPSPPDEEDRTEPIPYTPQGLDGWKSRYSAVTDPRVRMVNKLKRKSPSQGARIRKMWPIGWSEHELWDENRDSVGDDRSESGSDDEMDEEPDSQHGLMNSPSLPSYMPLGPKLLQTYFRHSQLLPLCSSLKPPDAAVAPTSLPLTGPPINVPTPVSPAAMIGAASERSRSLETAAQMAATEVVENSVWGDVWLANVQPSEPDGKVWQADVRAVQQFISDVGYVQGSVDIQTLFGLDGAVPPSQSPSMKELDPPMISIGKGDAIIQVLPTALRFWERLGLGPRGGRKDVTAFVLFEADSGERIPQAESWLSRLSACYTAKHLGTHVAGASTACVKNGILPLRFDSFRKALSSLVASLPTNTSSTFVLYIVTPINIMSLASALFRQVCSTIKRTLQGDVVHHVRTFFVPEPSVFRIGDQPRLSNVDLDRLCLSLYDRILRPIDRQMARRLHDHGPPSRGYFREPAFAIARPAHVRVKYQTQFPARTLDVMDRHTLLHVGYQFTACGRWVVAAAIDQRGESYQLGTFLCDSIDHERGVVECLWKFAVEFGRKGNVDWHLVIARLGSMGERELDAWITHLSVTMPTFQDLPMVQVTLLSVEQDTSWTFIAPHQNASRDVSPPTVAAKDKDTSTSMFIDVSAATYVMSPTVRVPLTPSPGFRDLGTQLSCVVDPDNNPSHSFVDWGILPLATTTLIRVPAENSYDGISMLHMHLLYRCHAQRTGLDAEEEGRFMREDVARNYQELCSLGGMRMGRGHLPWHLKAVLSMGSALEKWEDWV